ncbi:MAG: FAD-dependent oxidoreductase [Nitrospiraceae bacterium]|nr:MAG: FAD-dependent oxidoreductase [Nitrospiraceae bacterium]
MGKDIVLAGGGHAHMTVMANCQAYHERGHRVTLISPEDYHYYSGMGPGMLSGIYKPQEIRFNVKKMMEDHHGRFLAGSVNRVNPDTRQLTLDSGETITYDVVSFNVGSGVPDDVSHITNEKIFPVKPILNLLKAKEQITKWPKHGNIRILVVGGGPAGVEVAGNIQKLTSEKRLTSDITIAAGTQLLRKFPEKVRAIVEKSFQRREIKIIKGTHVKTVHEREAVLENGETIKFDFAFLALGVKPPSLFQDSGIPTDKAGGMLVNQYLQSIAHPEIFGGGDCIGLQGQLLEKVGVYAVRENPVLYHNLMACAEGKTLTAFDPGGRYLLIFNLGDGTGIFWRGNWVWNGKLPFHLKDYIDNRFMKRFQVSGERNETEPSL